MPASRRLWLALEIGLAALVVTLAAYGVSAALRAATVDEATPRFAPESTASGRVRAPGPLESYGVIATRDLFNPLPATDGHMTDGLRLWGVGLHGARGHAVIEDVEAHRQELYRVGDTIRGARITAIAWDRVTLQRDGVDATLELAPPGERRAVEPTATAAATPPEGPARIRRTGADAFIVDRRELEGATSNMSGLMTQLRAVAEVADGRPAGFRLFQIKEDSVFRRLGIQDGDVVQRINGTPVSDPASLLAFLERLRSEPRVAVDIVRGGTARTLVYDLR
jgi:general secretion pathway protein C